MSTAIVRDTKNKPLYFVTYIQDISNDLKNKEEILKRNTSLKKALDGSIKTMVKIVEMKDPYTSGHQEKVSEIAVAIAKELKIDEKIITAISTAALIHDIGKITIPSSILSKPGKLSSLEFEMIKEHSKTGYEIIKEIDFGYPVADIILQHHEKINGSGYPEGLKGTGIMLEAKIITVADVVEAMSSHRPYRPSLGKDAAIKELNDNKGILYDSGIVDACVKVIKEKQVKL